MKWHEDWDLFLATEKEEGGYETFVNILKTVESGMNIWVFVLGVHTGYFYVW